LTILDERAAPPGCRTLREVRGVKSFVVDVMYSYMFSIKVGAQCVISTGWPIEERVLQAEKIVDEDGGHDSGGNERTFPFGRFDRAMEMPAMWYLLGQICYGSGTDNLQWEEEKPVVNLEFLK
jgi:hypothetical protein